MAPTPAERRYRKLARLRRRKRSTLVIAGGSIALGLAYLAGLASIPLRPGRVSVVDRINGYGPVWVTLFLALGVLLVLAVWCRPGWLPKAHAVGCGIWGFYALGLLLGAYLSSPNGTFALPIVAGMVAWLNWLLGNGYIEDGAA